MHARFSNSKHPEYKRYGGHGISVCEHWKDFRNFLVDMGERPSLKHSIDRFPEKNGDYGPGNCRWATIKEQAANRNPRYTHMPRPV
jgi:hypothetical protein